MTPFADSKNEKSGFLKHNLADTLREEIISGRLAPGDAIVETQWAPKLKVAQASIREAINILTAQGFIEKEPGRSARVIRLTEADVAQIYQLRVSLEGLAARLAAERNAGLTHLEQTLEDMRSAARQENLRAIVERDLSFHIQLCETSGNRFLAEHARQLLVPLFAFTLIRASKTRDPSSAWAADVSEHALMLNAIRSGDPVFAEQTAAHVVRGFACRVYGVWARDTSNTPEESDRTG